MLANCSGRPITRVSVAAESFLLRLSPSGLSALQMAYHRSLDGYLIACAYSSILSLINVFISHPANRIQVSQTVEGFKPELDSKLKFNRTDCHGGPLSGKLGHTAQHPNVPGLMCTACWTRCSQCQSGRWSFEATTINVARAVV